MPKFTTSTTVAGGRAVGGRTRSLITTKVTQTPATKIEEDTRVTTSLFDNFFAEADNQIYNGRYRMFDKFFAEADLGFYQGEELIDSDNLIRNSTGAQLIRSNNGVIGRGDDNTQTKTEETQPIIDPAAVAAMLRMQSRVGSRTFLVDDTPNTQYPVDDDFANAPSVVNRYSTPSEDYIRETAEIGTTTTDDSEQSLEDQMLSTMGTSPINTNTRRTNRNVNSSNYWKTESTNRQSVESTQTTLSITNYNKILSGEVDLTGSGNGVVDTLPAILPWQSQKPTNIVKSSNQSSFFPIPRSPTLDNIRNSTEVKAQEEEEVLEDAKQAIAVVNELDYDYKTILERWHDFGGNISSSTREIEPSKFSSDVEYAIFRALYQEAISPGNISFDYLANFFKTETHRTAANDLVAYIDDPYALTNAFYEAMRNLPANSDGSYDITKFLTQPDRIGPLPGKASPSDIPNRYWGGSFYNTITDLESIVSATGDDTYSPFNYDNRFRNAVYESSSAYLEGLSDNTNINYAMTIMYKTNDSDYQNTFTPSPYENDLDSVFYELIELIESDLTPADASNSTTEKMMNVYNRNIVQDTYIARNNSHIRSLFGEDRVVYPSGFSNEGPEELVSEDIINQLDQDGKFIAYSMLNRWDEYIDTYLNAGQSFAYGVLADQNDVGDHIMSMLNSIGLIRESVNADTDETGNDYVYKFYNSFTEGTAFVDSPTPANILRKARLGYNVGQLAGSTNFRGYSDDNQFDFIGGNLFSFFTLIDEFALDRLTDELRELQLNLEQSYQPSAPRPNQSFLQTGSLSVLLNQNLLMPELSADFRAQFGGVDLRSDSNDYTQDVPGQSTETFRKLYIDNPTKYNPFYEGNQGEKGVLFGIPIVDIERQAVAKINSSNYWVEGVIPPEVFSFENHDKKFLVGDFLERGHIQNIPGNIGYPGQPSAGDILPALGDFGDDEEGSKEGKSRVWGKQQFFPFLIETDNRGIDESKNEVFCSFQALINSINETSNPSWQPRHFFGRTEQIHTYIQTERNIDLNINIYADTMQELANLKHRVNFLLQQTYGQYSLNTNENSSYIAAGPIVRLTLGDLYTSLPGIITSLNINWGGPNGAAPHWEMTRGLMIPWICTISMTYKVMHNDMPHRGYDFYWNAQYGFDGGHEGGGGPQDNTERALLQTSDKTYSAPVSQNYGFITQKASIPGVDSIPVARETEGG